MPIEINRLLRRKQHGSGTLSRCGPGVAGERNSLALAYVRHAKKKATSADSSPRRTRPSYSTARQAPRSAGRSPFHRFFGASTPEVLSQLATSEQAELDGLRSETGTADGHVEPSPRLGSAKVADSRIAVGRRLAFASANGK